DEARKELDSLVAGGIDRLPWSSSWLVTFFCVVEAAAAVDDERAAALAYDLMKPFAGRPAMASLAIACLGPVARSLGLASRTAGRIDEAVAHLEAAVDESRQLGNRPFFALSQADLAATLTVRGAPGDAARAASLADEAVAALDEMGLNAKADRIRAARPGPPAPPVAAEVGVLHFTGGTWDLRVGDDHVVLADGVGLRYLARLLAAPGVEIGADELAGPGLVGARQDVIDEKALHTYRDRIRDLQEDLQEAEDAADLGRVEKLRLELDNLLEHVGAQMGLGGQSRSFADERERARTAVQKALRRAIDRVRAAAPELGEALLGSVRTGSLCSFEPGDTLPRRWDVTGPR
ncbi:MAG: hypothetical protein M3527_06000, partial [Actinomycetota bacterium]|nr:hypothetical protein [Actinomycetota bacterium]